MAQTRVRVAVETSFRRKMPAWLLRGWAERVLLLLGPPASLGLDVAVTDDTRLRELNRLYRGLDEETDVLAFPFQPEAVPAEYYGDTPPGLDMGGFVVPAGEQLLGEIVIAFPYAARQAEKAGHPVQDEVRLLLVHGILHLSGYDHMESDDERVMWAKTNEILEALGQQT